uniref:Uncharacterized protein n=1 Tax=Magnetospirillum gryphiswaldense TaxID=55518 RepID=A4TYE8_9PROT|nr:conserved hypothetical protein [Magnetospirillum gryphiswaldense MSR-1]
MEHWSMSPLWWITAVELPVLGGLFWLIWRSRQDADDRLDDLAHRLDVGVGQARESLAPFSWKWRKAMPTPAISKTLERRPTSILVRHRGPAGQCGRGRKVGP